MRRKGKGEKGRQEDKREGGAGRLRQEKRGGGGEEDEWISEMRAVRLAADRAAGAGGEKEVRGVREGNWI
jgi:hypothetical protein